MIEKLILDELYEDGVSVRREKYIEIEGKLYTIGAPCRRAYVNSISGRKDVKEEVPHPQQDAIFIIWGDTPTIEEIPTE